MNQGCDCPSNRSHRTAALCVSQKLGCLLRFQTLLPSQKGSLCIAGTELKLFQGKVRGGDVCFTINNTWCDQRNIHFMASSCSPDLEYLTLLCRSFWLPREFAFVIITAVYIPPQANIGLALKELYGNISRLETVYPEAALIGF